jgi:hypothetical protein
MKNEKTILSILVLSFMAMGWYLIEDCNPVALFWGSMILGNFIIAFVNYKHEKNGSKNRVGTNQS